MIKDQGFLKLPIPFWAVPMVGSIVFEVYSIGVPLPTETTTFRLFGFALGFSNRGPGRRCVREIQGFSGGLGVKGLGFGSHVHLCRSLHEGLLGLLFRQLIFN